MTEPEKNDQASPAIKHKTGGKSVGPITTGILLVILGGMLLIVQVAEESTVGDYWPIILICGGLIFYVTYFTRSPKPPGFEGILFPGTYLLTLGVLFGVLSLTSWRYMEYLWPTFVLGVGLSLGAIYLFGPSEPDKRRRDLLPSINILLLISVMLYVIAAGGFVLWPIILIAIGIYVILRGAKKR